MVRVASALALVTALAAAVPGCGAPTPTFDRSALLSEVTTTLILPSYEEAESAAGALRTATGTLCDAPTASALGAAQEAWIDAIVAWRATSPFVLDASITITQSYESSLTTAASVDTIDAHVAGTDPIDDAYVAALGAQDRGFFALEYLLFAYPGYTGRDDAQTLASLGDARRCAYARAVAGEIAASTTAVRSDWETRFAAELERPDGEPYADPQSAVNALIDGIANAIDQVRDARLGRPLGRTMRVGGVESPYARVSVRLMLASLEATHRAWSLTPHAIDALLRSRNAALADEVEAAFVSAIGALGALASPPLSEPFEDYVTGTDLVLGVAAYAELNDLQNALGSDVQATLGHNILLRSDGD